MATELDSKVIRMKKAATIALVVAMSGVVVQLFKIFQLRSNLSGPAIPATLLWDMEKQFIARSIISGCAAIAGILLFYFEKYLFAIILIVLALIVSRFIVI